MGTATFDVCRVGGTTDSVRGLLLFSGVHTTSTSQSSIRDGAAGSGSVISVSVGDILTLRGDEDMRVVFGTGNTATATSGIIAFANETVNLEAYASGTISIVDVA